MAGVDDCPATALQEASPTLLDSSPVSTASPTLLLSSEEASRSRSPRGRGESGGLSAPGSPPRGSAVAGESEPGFELAFSAAQPLQWSRRTKEVVLFRGPSSSSRPFRIPADMVLSPERGVGVCERRSCTAPVSARASVQGSARGESKFDPFSVLW